MRSLIGWYALVEPCPEIKKGRNYGKEKLVKH